MWYDRVVSSFERFKWLDLAHVHACNLSKIKITSTLLMFMVNCITTKKDTYVTFWAERIFFYHTYDTSMTIIVTKPGIIIDVVGSYFYDKKS